ncbi:hypothetical protein Clacol_007017 [Clathrus columnatus]|uniref:NADPH-dependent diflavin oxidoreductase 1 n=1 Tax=Clathrus columnatus TaxID=1419009 RepID=A0AAV5AGC8_9AGAM|nr:hypothetical protein Clacol_007017 [Clathrus columnatus]
MTSESVAPDIVNERELLILYATETGYAYEVALRVANEAKRRYFSPNVQGMDEYPISSFITASVVVFIVSTTGSGTPPRQMSSSPLWQTLLRSDLPVSILDHLSYSVFGLGDSAYERFAWAAKILDRRLMSLGATAICQRGEGDEAGRFGIEEAFDPWIENLFGELLERSPLPEGKTIVPVNQLKPPRVRIRELDINDNDGAERVLRENERVLDSSDHNWVTLTVNKRITSPEWFQDVRHLEFDSQKILDYRPGDIAVINPISNSSDVSSLLDGLGWTEVVDKVFEISPAEDEPPLPETVPRYTTLRDLFTRHLDINLVPRRYFFSLLYHFASDPMEREKLEEFAGLEGQEDLYEYCIRFRRTIREVILEFKSVQIPKEYIFDIFPPLRPREFSIASSSKVHPTQIHLCIAIVQYKTKLRTPRKGVCTSYLAELDEGTRIPIKIRSGLLRPPESSADTPIICVAPGTGIAPIRALLEERVSEGKTENILYFGCRSFRHDHYYQNQWKDYASRGVLKYRVAFSREREDSSQSDQVKKDNIWKVYVQNLLEEDAQHVWEILGKKKGILYICGQKVVSLNHSRSSNKMPSAVKQAIEHAAVAGGDYTKETAKSFVKVLEKEGRLFEECWG